MQPSPATLAAAIARGLVARAPNITTELNGLGELLDEHAARWSDLRDLLNEPNGGTVSVIAIRRALGIPIEREPHEFLDAAA